MGKRKPTMTHIWALQGQKSPNVIKANTPKLELSYANVVGLNPDEFEPALIRLTPSPSNYRLVGATEANQDVYEEPEGSTYSSMMEDLVAGRPLELEYLSGAVVRFGKALGIPTPVHEKAYRALAPLAAGKARG